MGQPESQKPFAGNRSRKDTAFLLLFPTKRTVWIVSMKVVFISNFLSHHQQPFCEAMHRLCDFTFLATESLSPERMALGWTAADTLPPYAVLLDGGNTHLGEKLLDEADVVIAGSAPENLIRRRVLSGKLVFRYSERPLKKGREPLKFLPRFLRWHWRNPPGKPIFLLCASAYAAGDYARFGLFLGKSFKWGYFPPLKRYEDPSALIGSKDPKKILWCGRFLDWKHPDDALYAAKRLRDAGLEFSLDLIGTGRMEAELRELCSHLQLQDRVRFLGPMSPSAVRERMERAGILLICSDRQEGWGATLNEAMNSGCALVCSHAVGAAPFLLEHGKNGLLYRSGDVDDLTGRIKELLSDPGRQAALGLAAYRTVAGEWNVEIAAERLLRLFEAILNGENEPDLFSHGPCSIARPLSDDWFRP